MGMLKELDIFVRSHLTPLKDEQVSLMRARWEREKRRLKEPAVPTTKRRRAVKVEVVPVVEEARPKRRRRTAAEVAVAEAEAQAEAARLAAEADLKAQQVLEAERAKEEEKAAPSLEERAAALFKDLAPAAPVESPFAESAAEPVHASAPLSPPLSAAPRSVIPTPVRPRPVASAAPTGNVPPRPVASAAPGAIPLEERRRDKKRKKGKKAVDQEVIAQNISRTLTSMKGAPARKSGARREEGPTFREVQEERRREEQEREKTRVRVTEFITVSELANILKVPPTQLVTFAFKELGQMVTINQRLDFDMIELIASAFGFQAVREQDYAVAEPPAETDKAEDLQPRPPVVTVMGHVDHGRPRLQVLGLVRLGRRLGDGRVLLAHRSEEDTSELQSRH